MRIRAKAVYPQTSEPYSASQPPIGHAMIEHQQIEWGTGVGQLIGDPWPALSVGMTVEVHDSMEWLWSAEIVRVDPTRSDRAFMARLLTDRVAMPMPPVVLGEPYRLPYLSGHAWSRRPEAGAILPINGSYYRVKGKPKAAKGSADFTYHLELVSTEEYGRRKGRTVIKDLTDPNASAHTYYKHNIGRIVQIGAEYLHITDVERIPYGDGEGRTIFGYNTFGKGRFVAPDKAEQLRAQWEAKEKIRSLELDLRVAQQDPDYGGQPADRIAEIKSKLEAAKERAKDFAA